MPLLLLLLLLLLLFCVVVVIFVVHAVTLEYIYIFQRIRAARGVDSFRQFYLMMSNGKCVYLLSHKDNCIYIYWFVVLRGACCIRSLLLVLMSSNVSFFVCVCVCVCVCLSSCMCMSCFGFRLFHVVSGLFDNLLSLFYIVPGPVGLLF